MAHSSRYSRRQSYEVILEIEYFAPFHTFTERNVNKGLYPTEKGCGLNRGISFARRLGAKNGDAVVSPREHVFLVFNFHTKHLRGNSVWNRSRVTLNLEGVVCASIQVSN